MNRDEAIDLAKRIVNCWWGGPPFNEWADYLQGLDDKERATQVFLRLRADTEFAPSFKRYSAEYRALAPVVPLEPPTSEPAAPKLTREQRIALLTTNGAPRRLVTRPRTETT